MTAVIVSSLSQIKKLVRSGYRDFKLPPVIEGEVVPFQLNLEWNDDPISIVGSPTIIRRCWFVNNSGDACFIRHLVGGMVKDLTFQNCYFLSSSGDASTIKYIVEATVENLGVKGCIFWGYRAAPIFRIIEFSSVSLDLEDNISVTDKNDWGKLNPPVRNLDVWGLECDTKVTIKTNRPLLIQYFYHPPNWEGDMSHVIVNPGGEKGFDGDG